MKRYSFSPASNFIPTPDGRWVLYTDHLAAIEQARKEEREACASLCEQLAQHAHFDRDEKHYYACSAAIRARKP